MVFKHLFGALALAIAATSAHAEDWSTQANERDIVLKDFVFASGEKMDVTMHVTTLGTPHQGADGQIDNAVMVLHGTGGSGHQFFRPQFADELYGPGQPLDIKRFYVILPDNIGHGGSSKPSDGMRMRFPKYTYEDMVDAQYRLVTEHLGIRHLRAVVGFSMGGMETWILAQKYPDLMDIAVPMASLPTEMSGRNWMLRRLVIDTIRKDPEWMNGNYAKPLPSAQFASVFYGIATLGGNLALQKAAPTRQRADGIVNQRLAAPFSADANDVLYQYESSRDYNATAGLERIRAELLAINSADDERNPAELGILEREIKRVTRGRTFLIPASDQTAGHATAYFARFWKREVAELLQTAPR